MQQDCISEVIALSLMPLFIKINYSSFMHFEFCLSVDNENVMLCRLVRTYLVN